MSLQGSQQGDDKKSVKSASSDPALRMAKKIQHEAEEYLRNKNVPFGDPIMAQRKGAVGGGNMRLITNAYQAQFRDHQITVYRYDVSIVGIKQSNREVMFTKKFKDDFTQADRRFRCRDVIESFMTIHGDIANQLGCMYNDLQSIMYTLHPFKTTNPKERSSYAFLPEQLVRSELFGRYKLKEIRLIFTPTDNIEKNLDTVVRQQSELMFVNRDLAQFLDIATSQEVFFRVDEHVHFGTGSSYLYEPLNFGFQENDMCEFPENQSYLGIGCQKAIRTVQGDPTQFPDSRVNGVTAVVVQPKKTPFHNNDLLSVKVRAMIDSMKHKNMSANQQIEFLERYLKGLMVETQHNTQNRQVFPVKGFDPENANQKKFLLVDKTTGEGRNVTVAEYFRVKYNHVLELPDMPLVVTETKGPDGKPQKNYFPMEVLVVCDNQRVKTTQQMPTMTAQAIRKCAVPPAILKEQVNKIARSLHLWDDNGSNRYLKEAGINVSRTPMAVNAMAMPLPEIQSGNSTEKPRTDNAQWRANKFFQPEQLITAGGEYGWAVYAFSSNQQRMNMGDLDQFLRMYKEMANNRGIVLGDPWQKQIVQQQGDMERCFQSAAEQNVAFMLCFHADADDDAHHTIKALERRYMIITQCVKMGTARNVIQKNQRLTMDNILNKTNIKLGGLNFILRSHIANDPTTLIIGFSSNHPAGGFGIAGDADREENPNLPPGSWVVGPPTVCGFAANVGPTRTPFDFVGDFVFQQARREEKVNVIDTIVQRCLHYFSGTRDGNMPKQVVIYRNDCSEGQYPHLLKYEIPMLKAALRANNCNATLTFIVCNKLQNLRFFQENIDGRAKAPDQNLKPGVVIDSGAVHPVYAEFFLNSHRALQGTARTPKYTVIFDEWGQDLRTLEQMTLELCFVHQIIFSPISLPAPVYIASMYAKRGRNLYNSNIDELKRENPHVQMQHLNERVSFYDQSGTECWIAEYRVNA